jgi:hypothetical protein
LDYPTLKTREAEMAKRPDSIEEYQRKRREREGPAETVPESGALTRGQIADRENYIKRGQEAWRRHKDNATWSDWLAIGQALSIGRQDAMAAAGTNQPVGSRYNAVFGDWLVRHGFDDIDKSDRHRLTEVMDNLPAVEAWRATLDQTARLRLTHPSTILRKWRAAAVVKVPREPKPTLRDSVASLSEESAAKDQRIAELMAHVTELEAAREVLSDVAPTEPVLLALRAGEAKPLAVDRIGNKTAVQVAQYLWSALPFDIAGAVAKALAKLYAEHREQTQATPKPKKRGRPKSAEEQA